MGGLIIRGRVEGWNVEWNMKTGGIVDDCNRVSSPEQEDCSWNGRARRVFLSDAEAPSQSASTSFVSLTSLWLIDNQKQNGNTDLAE
jgi:hypothetical protein